MLLGRPCRASYMAARSKPMGIRYPKLLLLGTLSSKSSGPNLLVIVIVSISILLLLLMLTTMVLCRRSI